MQDPSVKKLFYEQVERYSREDQSAFFSPVISLFINWLKKNKPTKPLEICEFGGGGGLLLSRLAKFSPKAKLTNVELVAEYRKYQILPEIRFINGSILVPKFADSSFDIIVIRDVLHHLIGENLSNTRKNQRQALLELKRLLKPGGAIFIEELVNQSKIAGRIIYGLSKINSSLGIRSKYFQISPHTIVAFLTSKELLKLASEVFGKINISRAIFRPSFYGLRFRLVHLGSSSGKQLLVIEKPR
ncbi:MAG: methyltransferase domain-containing protein [Patescibacteria group bacterium]